MIEGNTIEFKREYSDTIKHSVIAFANTDGGTIYIGLSDEGNVVGLEDLDGTLLRLTNMVRDAIRPDVSMFVQTEVTQMDGKNIIVLSVQRGTARPYYLSGKGIRPAGVFVRQGASSVPASEAHILDLIRENSGDCYEEARSLNQQLTFEKAAQYFAKKNMDFGETQMRSLKLIRSDGTYSNLGMLLSDQCVHTIKLAVFEGSQKRIFHDRKEITGSLFEQLKSAFGLIDQYNRTRAEFAGLERIDKRDYPPEAVREALLNAIVHRDYALSGATLISIFDDRIEIITLGGLVKGITFDDMMLGVSMLRNQQLANVFYRLRLIEAYGTGIPKIRECYTAYQMKPKIEVSDHAFKVTLPNTNFVQGIKENGTMQNTEEPNLMQAREKAVIELFEKQDTISRKDVEQLLNVSQATAVLILRDMTEKRLVRKAGLGRNTKYVLA